MKHTLGPWNVIEHNWQETSVSSDTENICTLRLSEEDVTEDNQDEMEFHQLANAKLIAAAPELLDGLTNSVKVIHALLEGKHIVNLNEAIIHYKAIIKKATE